MAKRAIIGIALGIFFAPIIYLLLSGNFMVWIGEITTDFSAWGLDWMAAGSYSMTAPLIDVITGSMSFSTFMAVGTFLLYDGFILNMFTWIIVGMWAGAIERSAKRGIGVGAGIWLGWLIIELILMAIMGTIGGFLNALIAQFFTLILVILMAAMFGAITKSEEF